MGVIIEALSAKQLSALYQIPPGDDLSDMAWAKLLQVWREGPKPHGGRLQQRIHWKHERVDGFTVRVYNHKRVAQLIVAEGKFKGSRPRIAYLYQHYHDALSEIVATASSANFISDAQEILA